MAIQGPNVRKLIAHKMSLLMIPPGCKDPFITGIESMLKPNGIGDAAREATRWIETAILAVRKAADPNPWRDAPDEDIAAEILRGIEGHKAAAKSK